MKRLLVLMLVAGASLVMGGRAALACSCAAGDPRTSLAQSDAAFVGRLVSKEAPKGEGGGVYSSGEQVTYTFSVERALKGNLGRTVDVEAAVGGASCGIEAGAGQRIGLLLYRSGASWTSGLCSQEDPDVLIRAAAPLPKPDGAGPVRFLIGGQFGEARTMALDARMRVLSYGFGKGAVTASSVCPGARRAVEVVAEREGEGQPMEMVLVAIRDLATFEVVREKGIRALGGATNESNFTATRAACLDPDGGDVLLFGIDSGGGSGRLVRLRGERETTIYEGRVEDALFRATDVAYVAAKGDVLRIDLASGRADTIASRTGGLSRTWSLSPNGRTIVGFAGDWELEPNDAKLVIVDLASGRVNARAIGNRDLGGPTAWIDDETFVAAPMDGTLRVFDTALRERSRLEGWEGGHGLVVVGSEAFGSGWGWLGSATLPSGPARTLAKLDSPNIFTLVAVSDPAAPTPEAARPTPVAAAAPAPADRDAPITVAAVLLAAVSVVGWRMTRRPVGSRPEESS